MVFCKSLNLDIKTASKNVNDFISIYIFYTNANNKNILNNLKIEELNEIIVKHKTAYAAALAAPALAAEPAPAYKTITNLQEYPPPTTTTTITTATSDKMLEALNENLLYIHDNYYDTIMAYIYNFLHTNRFTHSTFINIMGVDLLCNDLNTIYDIYYKTIIQQPPEATPEATEATAAPAIATAASPAPETPSLIQKAVREEIREKYKSLAISKKLDNFYTHMKEHLKTTTTIPTMLLSGGGMLKTFRITHSKSKKNTTKNTNNIIKKVYNNPRVYSKYNKLKHKTKKNKHFKHINKSVKRTHTILMH